MTDLILLQINTLSKNVTNFILLEILSFFIWVQKLRSCLDSLVFAVVRQLTVFFILCIQAGRYNYAVIQYQWIINWLEMECGAGKEQQQAIQALLLVAHLNLALCFLRLRDYSQTVENCNKVDSNSSEQNIIYVFQSYFSYRVLLVVITRLWSWTQKMRKLFIDEVKHVCCATSSAWP